MATCFVKTHELPGDDDFPAIALVRDGRDALISYSYFLLKTEKGIAHPSRLEFEKTLEKLIVGERFGGWSQNVTAWADRVGRDHLVRFEDLVRDPLTVSMRALQHLCINKRPVGVAPPSFQELHNSIPWFFRRGKIGAWRDEMPVHLQELFLRYHRDAMAQLGYMDEPVHVSSPTLVGNQLLEV